MQHGDGTLGTRFPAETIPPSADPLPLPVTALTASASADGLSRIRISDDEGFGVAMIEGVPVDARITMTITARPGTPHFGLGLRASGKFERAYELRFSPHERCVKLRNNQVPLSATGDRIENALLGVEGIDGPFEIDIVMKDDVIDLAISNDRTLINRFPELKGDRLFFFVENGEATFEDVVIRPLA